LAGDVKSRQRKSDGTVRDLRPAQWRGNVNWQASLLDVAPSECIVTYSLETGRRTSPPAPPRFVPVEIDQRTLLDCFGGVVMTAPEKDARAMQRWITLAEVEAIVGGGVEERRAKIRQGGLAGDLRWTREVFENGLTRWVRPTDWLPEPEWERGRLGRLRGHFDERGVRVEVRRDCAVSCFGIAETAQNRGGRPPKWDWDAFWVELCALVHEEGVPATQAELVGKLHQWFIDQSDKAPAESEIKRRVSKLMRRLNSG
jgi:hypothetical protein